MITRRTWEMSGSRREQGLTSLREVKAGGGGDYENEGDSCGGHAERHQQQLGVKEGRDDAGDEGEGQGEDAEGYVVVGVVVPRAIVAGQRQYRHEGDRPQQEENPCMIVHRHLLGTRHHRVPSVECLGCTSCMSALMTADYTCSKWEQHQMMTAWRGWRS